MTKLKDPKVIISVVNMSLKYEVDILLRRSLAAFTALYPATLSKWEIRHSRRVFYCFVKAYGRALPYVAIEISKKTRMDVILPSAMFECCEYSIAEIMDGVAMPSGKFMHLDNDSKNAILQGRPLLSHNAHSSKVEVAYTEEALRTANTSQYMQRLWNELHNWAEKTDGPDHWVTPLLEWDKFPTVAYSRLVRHLAWVHRKIAGKRRTVWKDLPKAFGLRDWDKLRRVLIH